ncbi:SKP1-interacting partner 15 [Lycium ferocissimum]|uniref:SKP1-interacting partner 15 n=1 Tax=Lycium ferocissimum TaxID=112874 RepID=UPI0028167F9D|nr:SKP1-interacting partner 15 [Lycium ferocissimum]
MDSSPFNLLPQDTLHQIFSHLTLREINVSKCVCKCLNTTLSSPSFLHVISTTQPPFSLLALRPSHRSHHHNSTSSSSSSSTHNNALHVFDTMLNYWFRFPLSFLPFRSHFPITSSHGLLYLWAEGPINVGTSMNNKTLIVCNPLTRQFKLLPQLGSAWCKHGSVLVGSPNQVLVLTELAAIYFSGSSTSNNWLKFSSNLPSKPRSPILICDTILALCDVGSPWRSQWKLFRSTVKDLQFSQQWVRLEKHEWGDIFDILKRPRLLGGKNDKVLMIGGLKSSYSLHSSCSTILILRLDLESLEWEEAGRMPPEMFRYFQDSSKFKVFGGGSRVCFSGKRVGRLALWEENECGKGEWRWIGGVPGNSDGLYRGFVFEARLNAVP